MRRLGLLSLVLTLSVSTLATSAARANPDGARLQRIAGIARATVIVPQEWDGIWTTVDSMYTCAGALQNASTGADTICGGKDYQTSAPGTTIVFTCTGTADATTIDMTCTGSGEVFTDCNADYNIVIHGTRSGDSYQIVSVINVTYSGTGTGCSFLPPQCFQFDSWGTRTGPSPTEFCLTPVTSSSWGRVKLLYR